MSIGERLSSGWCCYRSSHFTRVARWSPRLAWVATGGRLGRRPDHSPMSPASEQSRRRPLEPCAASRRAPVKSEGPLTALSPPLVHDNPPARAGPRTQLPAAPPDFEPAPPPVSALYCFLALITVLDTHLSDVLSFSARLQARAGVILEFPLSCVPEPGMVSGADQTLIKFVLRGWRVVIGGTSHVGLGD